MYNFKGISTDTIMLLEMNRFNNNKPFYEEHKKEINEKARQQLGALSLDLADTLYAIDENIVVNPKKVSRIRRDTRFTKDKTLYRANVWTMWNHPCGDDGMNYGFWCEFGPNFYSYGVGFWRPSLAFMNFFREELANNSKPFIKAFLPLVEDGFVYGGESYKRDKAGIERVPDALKKVYNQKDLYFLKSNSDVSALADESFVEMMKEKIEEMKDMYLYFQRLHEKFVMMGE